MDNANIKPGAVGNHRRPGDLGPKQIAWLDTHIIGFKAMREQALAARAHAAQTRAKLTGEPK